MADFIIGDIIRQLDDIYSECMTYASDVERRQRCQRLLEAAILAESASTVKAILSHPKISLYVDKYGVGVGGRDSWPSLLSLRVDSADVLKVMVEDGGVDPFSSRGGYGPPAGNEIGDGRDSPDRGFGVQSTVFETACKDGRLSCVRYLVSLLLSKDGPSRDASRDRIIPRRDDDVRRRKWMYYGAVVAVESDQDDVLEILLETKTLDVNAIIDNDIGTVLHVAAQWNSVECARVLLSWSACGHRRQVDVESIATDRQQTALMKAAEHNSIEVMKMLLTAGADINRQTHECSSALIISCHFGHKECVEILLAHGADPHLKNRWGFTALYMGTDTPAILERMLREPVDVNEHCGERQEVALHLATVIGSVDAIDALLDRGADINRRTIHNENALWLAAWKDHTDAARVLIQNNIDLDAESNGCETYIWFYLPVEVALGIRNYDIARMLLTAGCSLRNRRYFRDEAAESTEVGPLAQEGMPWVQMRSEAFDYIRADQTQFAWFKESVTSPTTLKNSCRRCVRRVLRTPLREKVNGLPFPSVLKEYLMMDDL